MKVKFCPRCGGKLKQSSENLFICTQCGFHFYINPKPSNALIIKVGKREILLVKRKFNPKKGYWDLPGGFIEPGETLESSTIREIREELGIEIKNLTYFNSYADRYFYQGEFFPSLCAIFITSIDKKFMDKIKPGDDVSAIHHFELNEIPYEKIAFEGIKKALRDFTKSINKESLVTH